MSKAIEDLTLSVAALELAAAENAAEIAALKAAVVPPVGESPELEALKVRVDAVAASIAPPKPAPVA